MKLCPTLSLAAVVHTSGWGQGTRPPCMGSQGLPVPVSMGAMGTRTQCDTQFGRQRAHWQVHYRERNRQCPRPVDRPAACQGNGKLVGGGQWHQRPVQLELCEWQPNHRLPPKRHSVCHDAAESMLERLQDARAYRALARRQRVERNVDTGQQGRPFVWMGWWVAGEPA